MLYIGETSLYEIILSIFINVSLVYCSSTPNLANYHKFLVTYICPNHLKLHMDTPKVLLYEIMLVFITKFLPAGCSRASKSGKITMRSVTFPGSLVSKSEFICKKHSLYTLIVVQVHIYSYMSDKSMHLF